MDARNTKEITMLSVNNRHLYKDLALDESAFRIEPTGRLQGR